MRAPSVSLTSLLLAVVLLLAGCGGATQPPAANDVPPTQAAAPAAPTTAAASPAHAAALEAADGQQLGGTVNVLGVLGGAEQEAFLAVFAPFEEATGISVAYESTRDLGAVLQTRVAGGNPPDIAANPSVGQMAGFARDGALVDLSQVLDMAAVQANYDAGLLAAASHDGKLYGIFDAVNLEGLIWYNAKQYRGPTAPASWDELQAWAQQTAAAGTTPWCIGLESGAASGWPGAVWITELLLRQAGPEKHRQWAQGELPWTSPEVRQAFETFGTIATDPALVYGGPTAVLATSFQNGGDALFTDPPQCYLHHQASFFGGILQGNKPELQPIDDIAFFPFPDLNPAYPGLRQISGEVVGMFNDTPQARAFLRYLATPEASTLLAESGIWTTPNKSVSPEAYPSALSRQAAQVLTGAAGVHYDASALMPQQMNDAFLKAILSYVQEPDRLDAILASLDQVQQEAYP